MDTWYRTMFQDMGDATAKHAQSVRSLREEIAVYRKDVSLFLNFHLGLWLFVAHAWKHCSFTYVPVQILNKERDLESLRTRNEFLEGHVRDVTEKYKKEEEDLQVTDSRGYAD